MKCQTVLRWRQTDGRPAGRPAGRPDGRADGRTPPIFHRGRNLHHKVNVRNVPPYFTAEFSTPYFTAEYDFWSEMGGGHFFGIPKEIYRFDAWPPLPAAAPGCPRLAHETLSGRLVRSRVTRAGQQDDARMQRQTPSNYVVPTIFLVLKQLVPHKQFLFEGFCRVLLI